MSAEGLVSAVIAAADLTLQERIAKLGFQRQLSFQAPDHAREIELGPVWLRVMFGIGALSWRAIRTLGRLTVGNRLLSPHLGEGIIEPVARRYVLDFGAYAELFRDGDFFGGRSGRPLGTLTPWSADAKPPEVLWLISLLGGTVDAEPTGSSELRGTHRRKLRIHVDLERAAQRTDFPLRVPQRRDFNELRRLALTVWIDEEHVRRIEYREDIDNVQSTVTIDLWDYGIDVGGADWTRLPSTASGA
jgi:hypothetical protein